MSRSLLIVENDSEQLAILERWFARAGYQVVAVRYPQQALVAAAQRSFQVTVVGHDVPVIDGVQLMTQLRRQYGRLRVVMLSYDDLAKSDADSAGVFAYLVKPFRKSVLEATVRDAFEQSSRELSPVVRDEEVSVSV